MRVRRDGEDELVVLEMVKLMLEKLGYSVLASSTPREALRIANEHPAVFTC